MPEWFVDLGGVEDPQKHDLEKFVQEVRDFLEFILKDEREFTFLWQDEPDLRGHAFETFERDVTAGADALRRRIPEIDIDSLKAHGLLGRPLSFKLRVLASISRRWNKVKGRFTVRAWLKQVFDAIDAVLDSLIQAAGGAGGILKEFKDALSALVRTR